jgi:hypothetical protein
MIYVSGHTFSVIKSTNDFAPGNQYKLYHIKPFEENKIRKFKYIFLDNTGKKVELSFSNSYEADSFIARLSGKVSQLEEERSKIKAIQTTDTI